MQLRPYQQDAHDAAVSWARKKTAPCLIEAATGAGKSMIVAAIARTLHDISKGKHILCLQPSKELLEQNYGKFVLTGERASVFSASVGEKCLRWPVVYGTPLSVKNSLDKFGDKFCAVILDEAHGLTPTVKSIVEAIREKNPNVRVIGMTATPYRLGDGYIYAEDDKCRRLSADFAREPYFAKLVYKIGARQLIAEGYLTPPTISEIGQEHYDTSALRLNNMGKFDAEAIDAAFCGQGRKTAAIVADVVARSKDRLGVMFFAATVRHAMEIMESLPPKLSAIVTGETPKLEREKILKSFKAKTIKYIVNVSVLTTGFDAPHVDVIALLRPTESVGLLQQMIGRGLRLADGKEDCLILDYAQNINRHCPDGDIFMPDIKAKSAGGDSDSIECLCEWCGTTNVFIERPNDEGFGYDEYGYFLDAHGGRIQTEYGDMPSHFGRRCLGETPEGRCEYRWTAKQCEHCGSDNDISARYCSSCKGELVDPNEKLRADFYAHKKDPTQVQTDEIIGYFVYETVSRAGNAMYKVDISTFYRSFTVFVMKEPKSKKQAKMLALIEQMESSPQTVTYKKDAESGFYQLIAFDEPCEEEPV